MGQKIISQTVLSKQQLEDIAQLHQICNQYEQLNIKINWDLLKQATKTLGPGLSLDKKCFNLNDEHSHRNLTRDFAQPNYLHLQLVKEGTLIGKISLCREERNIHLYGFCVDPSHQGQGIGKSILLQIINQFKSQAGTFTLEVSATNRHALRLYEKCGFGLSAQDDYYVLPVL
ncbi:GNAT family N-acetyltransferase [Paenactinomyces guangxiensis]|uniref:GNAT family N-acetyltransferase n=1 Tax=Paenactinomyces guangxiensis TaxID=1490290 RepID=A0A7W1WPD5_9BACL|nr:GNAT family N-acetyltransferase [Paenactinomyces guangxiensis]MBA4493629.1 GNAT family N-acetyltransferase [Paenactinomyces guangxiensis]MBH8590916.1 GNAT family N-acetyltransferase [Paenactinomyces guangxiensis]